MTPSDVLRDGPILLYDGNCGVCSQAVQWVLAHERSHSLRFAPIESTVGSELRSLAGVAALDGAQGWPRLRRCPFIGPVASPRLRRRAVAGLGRPTLRARIRARPGLPRVCQVALSAPRTIVPRPDRAGTRALLVLARSRIGLGRCVGSRSGFHRWHDGGCPECALGLNLPQAAARKAEPAPTQPAQQ
jgi:DCC1-like thiol-disulfide oxidoreductase